MAGTALLGGLELRWWTGTVARTVAETPRARTIALDVPGWPGHRPGQHVDVRLTAEDGYQAVRSYSIGSAPQAGRIEITVERLEDGEVSLYLVEDLLPGDVLEFRGPIGGYFVWTGPPEQTAPLLLVAGGSGIVPLMSMLRHRAALGTSVPCRLLYSSRSPDDVIYRAELDALSGADASLEIFHTFTREQPAGWTGYARRIDAAMLAEVAPPAADAPDIYVCGPTNLVEAVAGNLTKLGHDVANIRTERFGPTGG